MREKRGSLKSHRPKIKRKPSAPPRSHPHFSKPQRLPKQDFTPQMVLPETVSIHQESTHEGLPYSYNETKLVLMVRDPYWAYSYWDFSGQTWHWAQRKLHEDSSLKPMMRIHDLDGGHDCDLIVSLEAKSWYLHLGIPDHRFFAELGLGDGNSHFYLIARSNEVRTPRDSPSDKTDPEWSGLDFDEIYRLSGGGRIGLSSPGALFSHHF